MTIEVMVLFGGSLLLVALRRRTLFAKRRQRGILRIYVLVIELITVLVGLGAVTYGLVLFLQ